MIIWINGAYGSGKSTVARKIQEWMPNALIFDAEAVGNAVRDNMERLEYHAEFPEYLIWRKFVAELLLEISKEEDRLILCPMTVLYQEYLDSIFAEFDKHQLSYIHIILDVPSEEIATRILHRGEEPDCWCMRQKDRCPELLARLNGIHIDAAQSIPDVAKSILEHIS